MEWESGKITYVPLNIMIQDDKVTMAQFAVYNDLTDTEGWRGLRKLARKNKMRKRLINQAKLRSYRHTTKYMYGYRIPRDYAEAVVFDLENGNTLWQDATKLEMVQMDDYEVFKDMGIFNETGIPTGFKKIRVHLVFAVKHDGRHKRGW